MRETFEFQRKIGTKSVKITGIRGDLYSEDLAAGGGDFDSLLDVFKVVSSKDMVIMDVGANIGATAAIMGALSEGATIISFEPSNEAYQCLKQTVALNTGPKYMPLNVGAGASDAEATFVQDNASVSASFISSDLTGDTIKIRSLASVADEQKLNRLDFIKIDVEGYEPQVLEGMTNLKFQPIVHMEFNSWALASNEVAHMTFLKQILDQYECFLYKRRADGTWISASSVGEMRSFLHDNIVKNGCVDDIIFCHEQKRTRDLYQYLSR